MSHIEIKRLPVNYTWHFAMWNYMYMFHIKVRQNQLQKTSLEALPIVFQEIIAHSFLSHNYYDFLKAHMFSDGFRTDVQCSENNELRITSFYLINEQSIKS